jgi:hypothetical protein
MKSLLSAILLLASALSASAFNALQSFDFETAGNAQSWASANSSLVVANGSASGTATTGDPQITRTGFNFPGNASSGVLIRYRGSTNGNTQIFWGRSGTGTDNYSATRSITLPYSGNGQWRTLYFPLQGHVEWDDRTITRLRFDPAGSTNSTWEIDWLRVLSWDYDNDGVPDTREGTADSNANGLLDIEDFDANSDRMPEGWARFIANAPGSVRFDFPSNNSPEGWAAGGNLSILEVQNGLLTAQVTGADPQLIRSRLHLQSALIDGLILRVQSPSPGTISLFWTHDGSGAGSFGTARSVTVAAPASPTFPGNIYIDLRAADGWKGNMITALRIDPDFPDGTTFSIDAIHTSDGDYDRDGIHDMTEGVADIDGDGIAGFEDVDSDGDGLSDAEEVRRGWSPQNAIEATRDSDGDGTTDAAEAIAGTHPDLTDDRPVLAIAPAGSGFDITIQARHGRSYTLERAGNLAAWSKEPVVPQVQGSPALTWHAATHPATTSEFFRMKIDSPLEMHAPLAGGPAVVEIGSSETTYLDNGTLRMGTPTTQGGSINFLAPPGGSNLINWYDPGRLIQQSYYAGQSLNRTAVGQSPSWTPWSWNPIQGGDASGKKSQVIEMTQFDSGTGYFTRTIPLLWDMTTGEKAKSWIDQWNQFEPGMPDVIRVTCRFTCFRDVDDVWTEVRPRHQELPAIYLIRSLSKVVTYQGASPWTNAPVEDVTSNIVPGPPWIRHNPSENWVAMVNPTTNVGVGVYSPFGNLFWWVGATGNPPGGPTNSQTMHMAPLRAMSLGRDSILAYRYWMIHGNIETIRQRIYQLRELYPHG